LDGQEISVTMLWRSTLFITNFPRELDDAAIRSLFGNVCVMTSPARCADDTVRTHPAKPLAESKVCRQSPILLYHDGISSE
jgi:hypothetical protein